MSNTTNTLTTYSNTGLAAGATYYYQVAAINAIAVGTYSNVAGPAIVWNVAGAPTGLTGTPGLAKVDLSWTAPVVDGGTPITGYRIQRSTNGTTWSTLVANSGSTLTTYANTGLAAGSTYYYKVAALNAAGVSLYSTQIGPVGPFAAPSAPGTPTGVPGNQSVALTWTAPASDGGTPDHRLPHPAVARRDHVDHGGQQHRQHEPDPDDHRAGCRDAVLLQGGGPQCRRSGCVLGGFCTGHAHLDHGSGAPTNLVGTPGLGSVTLLWVAPASRRW